MSNGCDLACMTARLILLGSPVAFFVQPWCALQFRPFCQLHDTVCIGCMVSRRTSGGVTPSRFKLGK